VRAVEHNLHEAFKEKEEAGGRILDLWIDMPSANQGMQGGYLHQHFEKLDKDFIAMNKASKA
jgi:hypothetical protein